MQTRRILSTKILLSHHKRWLLNAGLSVVEFDFINIKPKEFQLDFTNEYLIFTSQNAVEMVLNHPKVESLRTRKCFCLGDKTANLLQNNQFEICVKAQNAQELAEIITQKYAVNSFTFFSGNLRLDTLPALLNQKKIVWNEIQVYETVLQPNKIALETAGILFFSPSGVQSFLQDNEIGNAQCFCIGKTTAKALASQTNNIIIANQPSVENVIIQCVNFYKKNDKLSTRL